MRLTPEMGGFGGTLERQNYLIGRFPVTFQNGASWHCLCREFAIADTCRHTREAAGMRAAQAQIRNRVPGRPAPLGPQTTAIAAVSVR